MEKLLNLAIEAALRAGEAILKIYNDPTSHLDIERKADDSPLTQADHLTPETQQFIEHLKAEYKQVKLTSIGSSLKICLVAEGTANIYPRFAPTMEWDTAAGHAIALAAGKNIYQTDEKTPLQYNKEDLHNPWFIVK